MMSKSIIITIIITLLDEAANSAPPARCTQLCVQAFHS
jgi:hypothetical protein